MIATADEIRKQVFSLPISERAALAHELILSLDNKDDFVLDEAYEKEIDRRIQSIEDGTAKLIPEEEVMAKARARLKKNETSIS